MNSYLRKVSHAWNNYDGSMLAKCLSFDDFLHANDPSIQNEDATSVVQRILPETIDVLVVDHLRCLFFAANQQYTTAYTCQVNLVQNFCKLLSSQKDDKWPLNIMYVLLKDLRCLAIRADRQVVQNKGATRLQEENEDEEEGEMNDVSTRSSTITMSVKPDATLEKAAEHMMTCFRTCALDSKSHEAVTKRWGMLFIVNELFRIYFRVNKLHLCKPLIRAIESSNLKDKYALPERVTYKFYVGRKFMFDNDFNTASEYLQFAFKNCIPPISSQTASSCEIFGVVNNEKEIDEHLYWKNRRAILIYLIPVEMLRGKMPSLVLLTTYDLLEFKDVVTSIKDGNLKKFNEALEKYEPFFISHGVFLILERLRITAYRNLFKKVTLLLNTHQIPVEAFVVALKFSTFGKDVSDDNIEAEDIIDADETECMLANLIFEGKIKGYISHQHRKVVVSKQMPFPPLVSV